MLIILFVLNDYLQNVQRENNLLNPKDLNVINIYEMYGIKKKKEPNPDRG